MYITPPKGTLAYEANDDEYESTDEEYYETDLNQNEFDSEEDLDYYMEDPERMNELVNKILEAAKLKGLDEGIEFVESEEDELESEEEIEMIGMNQNENATLKQFIRRKQNQIWRKKKESGSCLTILLLIMID